MTPPASTFTATMPPFTLEVLSDLLDHRVTLPPGYELTDFGAWVDWDLLTGSWLSSTEVAAIHIARGCAIAERNGELPLQVVGAVPSAIADCTAGWSATARRFDELSRAAQMEGAES